MQFHEKAVSLCPILEYYAHMIRCIHSILLLFALLIGSAGMNYVQAANVTLTLRASPSIGGRVQLPSGTWSNASNGTVSQSVVSGKTVLIQAQASTGYTFSRWNDNNTNASRGIQITSNKTYTAYFSPNPVTLTVTSNNTNYNYSKRDHLQRLLYKRSGETMKL